MPSDAREQPAPPPPPTRTGSSQLGRVATTAAVAEPVAAAALAAFAVSVAPPRSQKEIQTMPAMTEQQVLSRLLQVSGNACGLRRKEAPPPAPPLYQPDISVIYQSVPDTTFCLIY